jgi:hypothetical protein
MAKTSDFTFRFDIGATGVASRSCRANLGGEHKFRVVPGSETSKKAGPAGNKIRPEEAKSASTRLTG